jgi:hypothetical protein
VQIVIPASLKTSFSGTTNDGDSIALFEFGRDADGAVVKLAERHYRLVPENELSSYELQSYRNRRAD